MRHTCSGGAQNSYNSLSLDLEPCSWNQILGSICDGRSIENVYNEVKHNLLCAICYIILRNVFIMKEMSVGNCPGGQVQREMTKGISSEGEIA